MNNIGNWFESCIQDSIKEKNKSKLFCLHRLYDTRSTGANNFIPQQPGDFYGVVDHIPVLLEAKATVMGHKSELYCARMFESHQRGAATLWAMAGGRSVGLFYFQQDRRLVAYLSGQFSALVNKEIKAVDLIFDRYIPGVEVPTKKEVTLLVTKFFNQLEDM